MFECEYISLPLSNCPGGCTFCPFFIFFDYSLYFMVQRLQNFAVWHSIFGVKQNGTMGFQLLSSIVRNRCHMKAFPLYVHQELVLRAPECVCVWVRTFLLPKYWWCLRVVLVNCVRFRTYVKGVGVVVKIIFIKPFVWWALKRFSYQSNF